eukprot:CAMPEP_0119326788 /NCGR_PEP_ID=MMETSP1333-20130426/69299_1 /TAXON_ID=418940 /ORGANISM="Scyphosphaera apsteinii, Strain RCC1455" /LENGTH=60 /DNA_ID=CAMNT_0007335199 /DNA_START=552 /DNA_END=734 /DNA_ORIENTATION=-
MSRGILCGGADINHHCKPACLPQGEAFRWLKCFESHAEALEQGAKKKSLPQAAIDPHHDP